jgi:hypothetical protein
LVLFVLREYPQVAQRDGGRQRVRLKRPVPHAPGGGGPGPRHRGKKSGKALRLTTISSYMRTPGTNAMQPTTVNTVSDEATPSTASVKDLLCQAPIPPAITARLWGTSQKILTCGKSHLDHRRSAIQPVLQPVNAATNPATRAATINRHARPSIFTKPNLDIAIPASGRMPQASVFTSGSLVRGRKSNEEKDRASTVPRLINAASPTGQVPSLNWLLVAAAAQRFGPSGENELCLSLLRLPRLLQLFHCLIYRLLKRRHRRHVR